MKRCFILTVCCILLCALMLGACSQSGSKPQKSGGLGDLGGNMLSSDILSDTETEAPTEATQNLTAEDLVVTVRECQVNSPAGLLLTGEDYGDENAVVTCRMPALNEEFFTSAAAEEINRKISERLSDTFDNYETNYASGYCPLRTDYIAVLNDNVLSIVIETRTSDTPNSYFEVFNVDIESQSELTRNEVVALAGLSINDANVRVTDEINRMFDDLGSSQSYADTAKSNSLSKDNVDAFMYFFDDSRRLVAAYRYYWIAGAETYGSLLRYDEEML